MAALAQDRKDKVDRVTTPSVRGKGKKPTAAPKPRKSAGPDTPGPSTSSSKTPKTASQVSLRKTILKKAATRGESLNDELDSADESSEAVEFGPKSQMDLYKEIIARKKKELERQRVAIEEIPEQITTTSVAIHKEMQRTEREQTANPTVVNAIQDQEINIGNRLINALAGENAKADSRVILDELKDLYFDVSALNKTAGPSKPIVAPETLKRLNALRRKTQEVVKEARFDYIDPKELSRQTAMMNAIADEEKLEDVNADFGNVSGGADLMSFADGEDSDMVDIMEELNNRGLLEGDFRYDSSAHEELLNMMNKTAEEAQSAVDKLLILNPETTADQEIIEGLIKSNNQLIDEVAANIQPLIDAIENNDPNLHVIVQEVAAELNQSINLSNENDQLVVDAVEDEASKIALKAADIQDARSENLEEIAQTVEQTMKDFENVYIPKDPAVRRYMGLDDDEIIDIENVDDVFEGGEVEDAEEFLEKSRATRKEKTDLYRRRTSSIFASIVGDDEENLEYINLDHIIDESIKVLEEVVENLEEAQNKSDSKEEREKIQEVKEKTQEKIELLVETRENRVSDLKAKFEDKKGNTMFG